MFEGAVHESSPKVRILSQPHASRCHVGWRVREQEFTTRLNAKTLSTDRGRHHWDPVCKGLEDFQARTSSEAHRDHHHVGSSENGRHAWDLARDNRAGDARPSGHASASRTGPAIVHFASEK